jgi:prepilin-type processing-associated H-X9-DG protein
VLYNAEWIPRIPKNDYAVNGGDCFAESAIWQGPATLQQGDANQYPWTDLSQFTGICYQRSEVRPAMVSDGLSQTYLIGEKHVSWNHYDTYDDEGYNQSMYVGTCLDLVRWVIEPPLQDSGEPVVERFGSAHPAGAQFVFCDGSVHTISYGIDKEVHRRLGNRRDGLQVNAGE